MKGVGIMVELSHFELGLLIFTMILLGEALTITWLADFIRNKMHD